MSAALDHLARRAAADPLFLAHAACQQRRGLADTDLCAWLGVSPDALTRIRLCRAIRAGVEGEGDVRVIAGRFGCEVGKLLQIV